uniref:Glycine-rich protein n=1 Tax=Cucumis sativus TaxID=3659 RepID=A0A0A0KUR6_CUCSA
MGRRRGIRLIFLLFCSTLAISSAALQQQIFPTATESNYQQKTYTKKHGKYGVTNQINRRYSSSAITVSNVIRRGSGSGGGGGSGSAAAAGGGENGGSRPRTGGGTAVIPVYAAGSAQAHHRQGRAHNAGNSYENNMGLLVAAVLAAIAHLCRVF